MWIDLFLTSEITGGAKHAILLSSTSSLQGGDGFSVPHRTVQLEGKGQVIVADVLIQAGQWIWTSHQTDPSLDAPSYQKFLRSVPVDLVYDVIQ